MCLGRLCFGRVAWSLSPSLVGLGQLNITSDSCEFSNS